MQSKIQHENGVTEMANTQVSGEESYVKKLSIATLGCVPAAVKQEQTGKLAIARIFGKMTRIGVQEDITQGKTWKFMQGTFEGINMQDGTVLRSSRLYLPDGIAQVVEEAYNRALAKDSEAAGKELKDIKGEISFAFEIRSIKANNPAGYSYEAVALRSPQEEDELAEMRKALAAIPTLEQKRLQSAQGGKALEGQTGKTAKTA